jgi:hypothetical protein
LHPAGYNDNALGVVFQEHNMSAVRASAVAIKPHWVVRVRIGSVDEPAAAFLSVLSHAGIVRMHDRHFDLFPPNKPPTRGMTTRQWADVVANLLERYSFIAQVVQQDEPVEDWQ